jgi:hypothetical protein
LGIRFGREEALPASRYARASIVDFSLARFHEGVDIRHLREPRMALALGDFDAGVNDSPAMGAALTSPGKLSY